MNPKSQDSYTQAYNKWVSDQSPDNLAELVSTFAPTINSEIQQYSGPRELLRSRAKSYVIKAIRTYDPMSSTSLNSWVVTNLKQLSRYGKRLRPIHASEDVLRNAAELYKVTMDLEDRFGRKPTDSEIQDATGWSMKSIGKYRQAAIATLNQNVNIPSSEDGQGPEDPSVRANDEIPFARDAVYRSLDSRDRRIFDHRMGTNGKRQLSGKEIADMLKVSPAFVSQRASYIGKLISELGGTHG